MQLTQRHFSMVTLQTDLIYFKYRKMCHTTPIPEAGKMTKMQVIIMIFLFT